MACWADARVQLSHPHPSSEAAARGSTGAGRRSGELGTRERSDFEMGRKAAPRTARASRPGKRGPVRAHGCVPSGSHACAAFMSESLCDTITYKSKPARRGCKQRSSRNGRAGPPAWRPPLKAGWVFLKMGDDSCPCVTSGDRVEISEKPVFV